MEKVDTRKFGDPDDKVKVYRRKSKVKKFTRSSTCRCGSSEYIKRPYYTICAKCRRVIMHAEL
jgi:hypothetical protein